MRPTSLALHVNAPLATVPGALPWPSKCRSVRDVVGEVQQSVDDY